MKEERIMGTPALILLTRLFFLTAIVLLFHLMMGSAHAAEPVPAFAACGDARATLDRIVDLPQRLWGREPKRDACAKRMLVPLGHTVGIKLFSEGVMVVGVSDIRTEAGKASPAAVCGLKEGDIMTHINGGRVDCIEEVKAMLQQTRGASMTIRVHRGERQMQLNATPVLSAEDNSYKLGAWIRDSMGGIGTVTFYDPESGVFGALGHGIMDVDTMMLMPLKSGAVMYSAVTEVTRGETGSPGQLHGAFCLTEELGHLYSNTDCGIFGTMERNRLTEGANALPAAGRSEVQVGEAALLCNIEGDGVCRYDVEIERIYPETGQASRNLLLKVTDERLLKTTGGIVQGMSGSPILQNGKLIGAVTHVLVSDPTEGYGIFIDTMLSEAFCREEQNAS